MLSTSGEVLGSLRYTWEIEAWPHTFGNLVCFDANVVRDRYFYGSGVDAGPACDDCVCFRSDDVILDPIWAYRNRVGAIDRDGDDRWALIELMETSCPKCTAPAYFDHFVLNLEPGILTTEMVIVAERNGLLTRREAIAALHLLGETEMAGVLEQHLLAILPREE